LLALGAYPAISLACVRDRRDLARKVLAEGIDPGEQRKAAKAARAGLAANTFEVIGREWYAKTAPMLAENTKSKLLRFLETDVFPWISAVYNFAEHLPERRKMMQTWADYLDKLKTGAEVIPLRGQAA